MTTKRLTPIIGLAVCALALAAVASIKNPMLFSYTYIGTGTATY